MSLDLKVPPVALLIVAGATMWCIARVTPALGFASPYGCALGGALALIGLVVAVLGVAAFKRAETTVNPMHPGSSSSLVVAGIYHRTRNPMYLGFALVLIGWAACLSNALAFVVLPGFVLYLNRFQIAPEEKALESRFGRDFADYRGRVRRWI